MTSKNSFLASSKENNRRRILVWIASILVQIALYPGIMIVYLSRINYWNADGAYKTAELFKKALQDAVTDALGFKPIATAPITLLAVCIAIHGFSYLHSRRKIDLYQSVPVSARHRFLVIYLNGLLMYIIPEVVSVLLAIVIGTSQGALTGRAMAECGLAILMNFMYFLVVYNISVLAVMLTGNIVITGLATMTMLVIVYVGQVLASAMKYNFFDKASYSFVKSEESCIFLQYLYRTRVYKNTSLLSDITSGVMLLCIKWFAAAVVIAALAYLCYKKRPMEAAGKAIAIRPIKPFVKIIISVTIGMVACWLLYDATYYNIPVVVLGMLGGAAFCACLMESIFEFDIRAALKHLVSTGVSVAIVAIIFSIYYFDLFGYDAYVPDVDEVESVAIDLGPYQHYWEYEEEEDCINYISEDDYLRDNMFLTDIDAVCQLAGNGIGKSEMRNENEVIGFSVLYRLKSGREVCRYIGVNVDNPENVELLNRIMGTAEYREGRYQLVENGNAIPALRDELLISYSNGVITAGIPSSEAEGLREAWSKDMEQFDYSFARNNRPCGELNWEFKSAYVDWTLPVYEDFTNTIAFLEQYNAYYPVKLRAEDIASLEITNWHYDDMENSSDDAASVYHTASYSAVSSSVSAEGVREIFEDPEEIAEIIEGIYPSDLYLYWAESNALDRNYDIKISFKANTDYPYGMGYYSYDFLAGQVPDFVVERTAGEN